MVLPISSIVDGAKSLVTPIIQPLFLPFLYWMLTSLGTICSFWTNGDRIQDEAEFLNPERPLQYDFIVVGAGTAGCLLANRLSQSYSVLLIEAGGEPNPLQFIPGLTLFFANYPDVDWQHRTVPQRFGSLMSVNGESSWSTGLGLGGTGNLNCLIHLRGNQEDFNNWARITGDPSWSWEGVLPFFKRHENYEVPGDNVNHGYTGDLRIETPDYPPTANLFVKAGVELGYPHLDLNAPFVEGFDIIRYPMRLGVRQAPYKAFLEPIRTRASLTILKFAHVNKILFRNGNEAYGVEYDRHGKTCVAHARREVIISAGTVGSAKILMLSGVGPKMHLNELNIPVVSDLPVGENLQDHLGVYLAPFFIKEGMGNYLDRDMTIGQLIKYFTLGRGRLTSSGCESTGIITSSYAKARGEGDWPDLQLFTYGLTYFRNCAATQARLYNLKYDEVDEYTKNDVGRDALWLVVSGGRPRARGFIKLGGSSPYDKLIIDPNYLGDPGETDLKVLLEGVKKTVYLMENTTAGGVELGAKFTNVRLPGCEHLEFRSDAYWICYIRRFSVTLHHPVGTASMGSVVDTQLRVMGVRNLRVVDASIQPVSVVTNVQASVMMIAEKGADMILRYWRGLDQTGKYNNGNGKNRPSVFSMFGGGVGGGGFNKGNNLFWGNPHQNQLGILERTTTGRPWRNSTVRGRGHQHQLNLNELRGIKLPKEYPQHAQVKPVSEAPAKHKVPVYNPGFNIELMKQQLTKSFYDLKMVGELAKDNYNSYFKKNVNWKPMAQKPTTTTPAYDSNSLRQSFNNDRNQWKSKPVTNYADPAVVKNALKTDYKQSFRSNDNDNTLNLNAIPRPPSPPLPPTSNGKIKISPSPPLINQDLITRPGKFPESSTSIHWRGGVDDIATSYVVDGTNSFLSSSNQYYEPSFEENFNNF